MRRKGFTLLEVLATTTILGIAAAAAVPMMGAGGADAKLAAATRSVMSDLFYAQNVAITTKKPVFIFMTTASGGNGGSYCLLTQNTANNYSLLERPGGSLFVVGFGANAGTTLPVGMSLSDAKINSMKQASSSLPTTSGIIVKTPDTYTKTQQWANLSGVMIGFDTMGQPFVGTSATNTTGKLAATGNLELGSPNASTLKVTLALEPFTGEISIN